VATDSCTLACAVTLPQKSSKELKFHSKLKEPYNEYFGVTRSNVHVSEIQATIEETRTSGGQLGALGICFLWLQLEHLLSNSYHTHPSTSKLDSYVKSFCETVDRRT
jgi:hypothetical protein